MSHKRIPKRRAAMAAGGVVALGAAAILLPNANASQDGGSSDDAAAAPRTLKAADASDLAARLAGLLGDSFAGSYYDSGARQLVVNVVPGDNNQVVVQAEKAGAKVREVDNSMGELRGGAQTLKAEAGIPGTAWAIDPRTNKILVTADSTVTGDRWDRLESTVDGLGSGMATVRKSAGTFKTFASGGDAIFGGGARCSLGFNVTAGDGSPAFLTAGHCGVAADQWSDAQGGQPIATVDQAVFPGEGDFALVRYDDPATEAPSEVDLGDQTLPISGAAEAAVGQEVFRMGSTTGLADGQVLGLDATVNYPEGMVTGLIQTDVCAEPGDSGGSLFTRDGLAIGLTSGGSGDCTVGGETFFQPVTTALAAVGATLGGEDGGAGAGDAGGAGAGAGEEGDAGGAGDAGDGGAGAGDKGDTGDAGDAGDGAPVGAGDGSGLTG
ncbi:S1 family peptidase [Streptomyces coelicolor]|uniref:Protease n=1 Tax=Streptomyces coelicolor (strain ATCC BAA-471 / A3(2) / M145) TaxID=100226 RepID=Q9RJE0_STRCO|nr:MULTISPECIES: S1 family peptidase [Streptomyces]MYU40276.1 trypsin-like serine protease [Streptomyces sp. SID7813]NSL79810.1 S1 family peptidase [Streptomyces coelicolor]QFI41004.1 S1 family peptidase [Streptomyces coelicolor A3(2)]QKN64675.1 S1 family peptidase [Streptomyces coelicolor]TYP11908.1 streptogrisin D [Streptomyces coelicolor]